MRLKGKKVLVVLDDVDDQLKQLDELAGGRDWFGRGSRVIITTRDAGVLRSHGVDENYMYQVDTLEEQVEAIQLFSLYAFKKKIPKTGFEELCGSIVRYAMGLPLALKVLGSYLCGLKAVYWENILVKLKDSDSVHAPKDKILRVLRISFDGLDPENQNVFLHIACFLRNWREEVVKDVVDSDLHLLVLIEKSLISVQNGEIEMHDLIQEMGWHIASKENPRKMVWQLKDANDVLSGTMEQIEGIELPYPWPHENNTFEITLRGMRTLKILKVHSYIVFRISEKYLPSSLRWLEFESYHFDSLPESFASPKLVGLSLRKSSLQNCRITQKFDKLTLLDLRYSTSLLETPDFDLMPNLKRLDLNCCTDLKVVHLSIGNLRKLENLDLANCCNLESLPSFNQVSSLNSLDLNGCIELKNFPEIKERMPHLVKLKLCKVGIKELPSCIQQLHGLTELRLEACEHLVCLSNGFCELKNLKVLVINQCTSLKSLPKNLQDLISLEYLRFNGSYFDSFPESFNQLPRLQYLDIRNCENLKKLPKLPETTCQLYADSCFSDRRDIDELADFPELQSVAFSSYSKRSEYDFAEMCIHFPSRRKTPFSVTYPIDYNYYKKINVLRIFQYRCYESNGIAIDLNPGWNCQSFVGFAVCFVGRPTLRSHPYRDIANDVEQCTIIVKLSCKDNRNELLQRKCVIVKSGYIQLKDAYGERLWFFAYIPFSGLWPAKSNSVTPNDFSRFEVNFMDSKATANWGCSLLYRRMERPANWDESCEGSTTDIGPLGMLEYLNLSGKKFEHLPEDISRLHRLQYLDISGCKRPRRELPELPPSIRELYANSYLASENNIVELATKYSELYSVSFSYPIHESNIADLVPGELAKKFIPITQPFLNRNTPFVVTYPLDHYPHYNISRCFKYPHHDPHHDPHKISISLDPTWYNHNFVGFVVCFVFPIKVRWESQPNIRPFMHCELIIKLIHKDNGSEPPLETKCVIGRLYDEEFHDSVGELVCFAYIPFNSLWPKSKAIMDNITPNHYLVFEAAIQDLEISRIKLFWCTKCATDNATPIWSCGLLYTDDESLTEAIRKEREAGSSESDLGPNRTKLWEFTKIIDQVQCQVVSMPECSDAKVARLLYTNSGVGILALSSNGIKKLWKWPNNEQNPTEKATANSIPQHWQPNSGHDVSGINLEKVVPCIALSYDDSHIVSAVGGNVSLFNSMTFKVLTTFRAPSTPTFLVFYPGDNDIIAIGMEDATIIIYNVRLDKIKTKLIKGHHKHITGLAFSTTGPNILVSSSADARLCVWDIVGRSWQNRRLVRIQSPDGEVCSGDTHVMFHTVRLHLLLVTHETQLAIYDTSNMERKCQWTPQGCLSARISSATYSCNRKLVYASFIDGNIGVLDADNLTLRCRIAPSAYLSQPILNSEGIVYAVAIAAHPQAPNQLAIGLTDGSIKVIEPLEPEGEWGMSPPIDTEILNGTGEAEQREPNLANEDCEPEEISVRTQIEPGTVEVEQVEPNPVNEDCEPEEISVHTQIELGTVEVEQVEPNPVNEDCEPEEISVRTQIELGTVEVEQVEPNPVNEDCEPEEISVRTEIELGTVEVEQVEPNPASEDCEAAKKSVLTQLEQGTGEAEQTEPNPSNEDCEPDERSVVTQPELGTGEAEQSEPNPANEDCEAKVHSNKCALIQCFWKCC